MRIIAGKYKGRQLVTFKASHIRPTTDRVKESIFNKLMFNIEGSRVLDLFSGTGNLAFESLSRGAKEVIAVEQNKKSIQIINKNKELLAVTNELQIICSDVLKFLKRYSEKEFNLVFIDPPFTQKMAHEVMLSVSHSKIFKSETMFVIESSRQERIDDEYGEIILKERKNFGDKNVSFFEVRK